MRLPDPSKRYPIVLPDGGEHEGTVFLSEAINHPRCEIGEFTYASDFDPPEDWAARLAPYLFPFSNETLRIGKFCQIAHGVRFLTSSANHATDGLSCYPFPILDPDRMHSYQPDTRDTVVGHDVWIGYGALILPGARIGNGAIIGAGTVVRGTVPDYAIVTGNPGRWDRFRFPPDQVQQLLKLAWWDWPVTKIETALPAIVDGDIETLTALSGARTPNS